MTAADDDHNDEALDPSEEDEFADDDEEVVSPDLDEFVSDTVDEDVDDVVELSPKELNARSLEIRREIEKRREERQFHEDIDYLDMDFDE